MQRSPLKHLTLYQYQMTSDQTQNKLSIDLPDIGIGKLILCQRDITSVRWPLK